MDDFTQDLFFESGCCTFSHYMVFDLYGKALV